MTNYTIMNFEAFKHDFYMNANVDLCSSLDVIVEELFQTIQSEKLTNIDYYVHAERTYGGVGDLVFSFCVVSGDDKVLDLRYAGYREE